MFKFLAVWVLLIAVVFGDISEPKGKGHVGSPAITMKIYNGLATDIQMIPHQISLGYATIRRGNIFYEHTCGGSIIASNWVVTAGHCLVTKNYELLNENMILAGSSENKGYDSSWHKIKAKIIHPKFYSYNGIIFNDIALVRVLQPFVYSSNRQPVPLYEGRAKNIVGVTAVVSGWGTVANGKYPTILNALEIPIVAKSVCRTIYGSNFSKSGHICGGYYNFNEGPCNGDSGGPLTVDGYLVGIVSWGPKRCGKPGTASVFTEVAHYRMWIKRVTGV